MANLTTKTAMMTRSMARSLSARACTIPSARKQKKDAPINVEKETLQIVDYPKKNMFIMKMGAEEANVEYTLSGNTYDLVFSNVPANLQGRGLGKILAQTRHFCTDAPAIVQLDLVEDRKGRTFKMELNGEMAAINFEFNDNIYTLSNTSVPENYRGRGVAKILAQKTFDHIVEKNMKMKLTCEFLEHYYKQNQKRYAKYVV